VTTANVCAVIHTRAGADVAARVRDAAATQTVRPARILTDAGPLASAVAAASGGEAWVWLLDGLAVPAPDALAALLAAAQAIAPPPALVLASVVRDRAGRLHPDALPRHELFEKRHSIEAAEHHLVQLRAAGPGSVLVAATALARFGPPRAELPAGLDMREWTARILRGWEDTGYLVPASRAVREGAPATPTWHTQLARVRVLASPAWSARERLWEGYLLGRELTRRQGRAGVGAPGAIPSRTPRRMTASACR
jgi:hypothetical protein